MNLVKWAALAAISLLGAASAVYAADEHHPAPSSAASAPQQAAAAAGGGGMAEMMQMMRTMMPLMPATHGGNGAAQGSRAQMNSAAMSAQDEMMIGQVEGRIAFLHAELKITPAQEQAWRQFSRSLRATSAKLAEVREVTAAVPGLPSTLQQLGRQERWFSARLDGVRAIKAALEPLFAALSDEQKQRADELLPLHLGLIPVDAMAMLQR